MRLSRGFYWESDSAHRFTLNVNGPSCVSTQAPDSLIGKTRWEIPSTRPDAAGWEAHKAVLDAHIAFRDFGFARVGADGAERQFIISGEPVFDARGRFAGYCGIGEDITERKRAEEALRLAEERYRTLVDLSPDGIVLHEMGVIQYANSSAATMFGAESPGALLGRSLYDLIDPQYRDAARERAISLLQKGVESVPFIERRYQRLDGKPITVEVAGVAIRRGGKPVVQTVLRDVTARKRAEQLLKLEHAVARCLADADSTATALRTVIRAVCESENWEFGRYFRVDEKAGVTRFTESWCMPGEANQVFIERSRELAYGPGVGLTGKVWQSGQALWVSDIHRDARTTQAVFTLDSGIHGAFAFPVKSEGKTIGVLAFNSRDVREPDERLLLAVGVIGDQIGQFLRRMEVEEALRESEERFRSMAEISADWYWEQDADFRFTRFEDLRPNGNARPPDLDYLGKRRWETGLEIDGGWESHRASLQAHEPFRDVVTHRTLSDGRLHYFSLSGEPVYNREGRFAGYRGVARDVTESKRDEKLVRLEHAVVRCLANADSAAAALKTVIRAVCESENWAFGRYFRVDEEAGVLRFDESWSVPGSRVEEFITGLSGVIFKPGVGLAGSVWQTGQPLWIPDINEDARAIQAPFIPASGIRGAFVFPVKAEGRTIGILAFNSREIREPDERLLLAVGVIGNQIGQFLQRKQTEDALRESEERFRSLTQMSSDFFWETDTEHRFTKLVYGREYTSTQPRNSQLGKTRWDIPSTRPDAAGWAAHKATMDAHLPFYQFEFSRARPDGTEGHYLISGEPRFGAGGVFLGYRGVGTNVTDLVQARERISQLAYTDPLTGLANRTSLHPALDHAVNRAHRYGRRLAIMFIDLDGFKAINDVHGHEVGDRLLNQVAVRLRACLRSSDLVARHGGDEFVVVLEDVQDTDHVEAVAGKLVTEIARPYSLVAGEESRVSASIGISMLPDDADDQHTLMKHADTAMYRAKQSGKNGCRFYAGEPLHPRTRAGA